MKAFLFLIGLTVSLAASSQDATRGKPPNALHLWPGLVPGAIAAKHPPKTLPAAPNTIPLITDVTDPLVTIFRPGPQPGLQSPPPSGPPSNRGIGIIICPGGGNKRLSDFTEGQEVAKWFTNRRFTAFVLQYRVPDQRAGALQDIQRAIRLIRSKAVEWNLDPNKLGVMGFSAGGNLAARASTEFNQQTYAPVDKADSLSCRPDFAVLVYPGGMANGPEHKLIPELTVDKNTSPTFLFVANDDPVGVPLSYAYALHDAKVPMELHVVPNGGHGFGLRRGNGVAWEWPPLAEKWIMERFRSLKETFRNDFRIGTAIGADEINGQYPEDLELATRQFNAVSSAVLEWSELNPRPGVYNFETADKFVRFGESNKLFIIAHGLIWHHLVPDWIFQDNNGHTTTRDTLLQRMRNYIFTTVRRYKGRIGAWIVANEAFENNGQLRKTKWLEIIGKDYLQKAFEYAHEADPAAKLYYNDFDCWMPAKRAALIKWVLDCRSRGTRIDGIGIQGHWNLDYPSVKEVEGTLAGFSAAGIKIMITEMDMSILPRPGHHTGADITDSLTGTDVTSNSKALDPHTKHIPDSMHNKLAIRYAKFFALFHQYRQEIAGVNFWGVNDRDSWRNDWPIKGRTDYPMLFDRADKPKPAFYAVINIITKKEPTTQHP